jgi:hypothetical protein
MDGTMGSVAAVVASRGGRAKCPPVGGGATEGTEVRRYCDGNRRGTNVAVGQVETDLPGRERGAVTEVQHEGGVVGGEAGRAEVHLQGHDVAIVF